MSIDFLKQGSSTMETYKEIQTSICLYYSLQKIFSSTSEMATIENEERWLRNGNHCCSPSDVSRLLLKVS